MKLKGPKPIIEVMIIVTLMFGCLGGTNDPEITFGGETLCLNFRVLALETYETFLTLVSAKVNQKFTTGESKICNR